MSLLLTRILYRVPTVLLALFILPGVFFMHSEMAKQGLAHVGLSEAVWLAQLVGYAQPLAILTILIPGIWNRVKEWAYVGLGFVYIGAFWAHFSLGHPVSEVVMPVVTFTLLVLSYCMRHKLIDKPVKQ